MQLNTNAFIVIITYAKEVMFSLFVCLFVCSRIIRNDYNRFSQFFRKVAHGPRKKPLDLGVNTWIRILEYF